MTDRPTPKVSMPAPRPPDFYRPPPPPGYRGELVTPRATRGEALKRAIEVTVGRQNSSGHTGDIVEKAKAFEKYLNGESDNETTV